MDQSNSCFRPSTDDLSVRHSHGVIVLDLCDVSSVLHHGSTSIEARNPAIDYHCVLHVVPGSEASGRCMEPATGTFVNVPFLWQSSPDGVLYRSCGLSGLRPAGESVHHREVCSEAAAHDAGAQPPGGASEHSTVAALATLRRYVAVDLDGHCLMVAAIADADELGQVRLTGQAIRLQESGYAKGPDLRVRPPLETLHPPSQVGVLLGGYGRGRPGSLSSPCLATTFRILKACSQSVKVNVGVPY